MKRIGLITLGIAAAGIAAITVLHEDDPVIPLVSEAEPHPPTTAGPPPDSPQEQPATPPAVKPMFPVPTKEEYQEFVTKNAGAISRMKQRETDQLVAAGFSLERIAWIRERTEALVSEQARAAEERKEKGLRNDDPFSSRYLIDSDLDLREEMSEDEYTRYRSATGRSIAVPVTGVLPGSGAEAAGLQVGDAIVTYDGKRVFNYYDLQKAAAETGSTEVQVEVSRDGRIVRLAMPKGSVGINEQSWAEMQLNNRPCSAELTKRLPPDLLKKVCNPGR